MKSGGMENDGPHLERFDHAQGLSAPATVFATFVLRARLYDRINVSFAGLTMRGDSEYRTQPSASPSACSIGTIFLFGGAAQRGAPVAHRAASRHDPTPVAHAGAKTRSRLLRWRMQERRALQLRQKRASRASLMPGEKGGQASWAGLIALRSRLGEARGGRGDEAPFHAAQRDSSLSPDGGGRRPPEGRRRERDSR